jgi:RNA polymerase I-specific transcription initiation factor RRN3
MQFTRVAHSTEFMYCYSILEAHRRSDGPTSRPSRGTNTPATPVHPAVLGETIVSELNTFFPFDPYKLPRSNSYIAGVYREWSSVAIDDGGEDDDDGDGDGEDEGEGNYDEYGDGDYRGGTHSLDIPSSEPFGDDLRLGASFEGMSISPAP